MPVEVPYFKIPLDHLRYNLIEAMEKRKEDINIAIDKAITTYVAKLPEDLANQLATMMPKEIERVFLECLQKHLADGSDTFHFIEDKVKTVLTASLK